MVAFLLVVAIPVFIVIMVLSMLFRREAIRIARERTEDSVARTAQNLDSEASSFAFFTSALLNDKSLQENAWLFTATENPEIRFQSGVELEKSVAWFFRFTSRVGTVLIFFKDGKQFHYSNYPTSSIDFEASRALIAENPNLIGEVWCLDSLQTLPGVTETPPIVSMAVRPSQKDSQRTNIESILVAFRVPLLENISKGQTTSGIHDYLLNGSGTVILASNKQFLGKSESELLEELSKQNLSISAKIPSTGWTLIEAIPLAQLTHTIDVITGWVYVSLLFVLFLFLAYTRSFFSSIIQPLHSLIDRMERVSTGDFSVQVDLNGIAEFRTLETTFNAMVRKIKELNDQVVEEQKERDKLENEALRYQLNPHFICNTLNSITLMASIAKVESIRKMTVALTKIMQKTLNDDDTVISLKKELENLESYVYIMTIRFGNSFSYHVEVDSSLLSYAIPTMLLQPLVENSILHGVRKKKNDGAIWLTIVEEHGLLRISVHDNGVGMSETTIRHLLDIPSAGKRGFNRIGMYNVSRRILLSYPEKGAFTVDSEMDKGTVVTLCIPKMHFVESVDHV